MKKIIIIIISVILLSLGSTIFGYFIYNNIVENNLYKEAISSYEKGNYSLSIELYQKLYDKTKSNVLLEKIEIVKKEANYVKKTKRFLEDLTYIKDNVKSTYGSSRIFSLVSRANLSTIEFSSLTVENDTEIEKYISSLQKNPFLKLFMEDYLSGSYFIKTVAINYSSMGDSLVYDIVNEMLNEPIPNKIKNYKGE